MKRIISILLLIIPLFLLYCYSDEDRKKEKCSNLCNLILFNSENQCGKDLRCSNNATLASQLCMSKCGVFWMKILFFISIIAISLSSIHCQYKDEERKSERCWDICNYQLFYKEYIECGTDTNCSRYAITDFTMCMQLFGCEGM